MKISDIQVGKELLPQPKTRTVRENSQAFEKLLSKSVARNDASGSATEGVHTLRPAPNIFLDVPGDDREELADRVARLLGELEEYADRLGSGATLKDIAPIVERISDEQSALQQLAEHIPAQDDIRHIIDEALVRSSVEVIKFNRGDYV
jgi:hypothetical protein